MGAQPSSVCFPLAFSRIGEALFSLWVSGGANNQAGSRGNLLQKLRPEFVISCFSRVTSLGSPSLVGKEFASPLLRRGTRGWQPNRAAVDPLECRHRAVPPPTPLCSSKGLPLTIKWVSKLWSWAFLQFLTRVHMPFHEKSRFELR